MASAVRRGDQDGRAAQRGPADHHAVVKSAWQVEDAEMRALDPLLRAEKFMEAVRVHQAREPLPGHGLQPTAGIVRCDVLHHSRSIRAQP